MPFPHIDQCIICDSARPELGGKSTILGFYGIAPNVDIRVQNLEIPLGGITFFFVGGAGEGAGNLVLEVKDWSGTLIFSLPPHPVDIKRAERINLPFVISGLIKFPRTGRYVIRLLKDGNQIFRDTFMFSVGSPEEFAQFGLMGGQLVPKK